MTTLETLRSVFYLRNADARRPRGNRAEMWDAMSGEGRVSQVNPVMFSE